MPCRHCAAFVLAVALAAMDVHPSFAQQAPARPVSGGAGARPATTPPTPQAVNADGEDYSGPILPKDFAPPRKIPEMMTEAGIKDLLPPDLEKQLFAELQKFKFQSVLTSGDFTEENKRILEKTAKYYVYQLTQKSRIMPPEKTTSTGTTPVATSSTRRIPNIIELREKLARDANSAGSRNKVDLAQARKFREYYLRQVVARLEELLDGHLLVRTNAVILLGELSIENEEPYADAVKPLLKVILDKDQPESVKMHAPRGIARICLLGKPSAQAKLDVGLALVSEIQRKDTHYWYQWRLAEALGTLDSVLDQAQKPFIAQTLGEIVVDDTRHCLVRSEAARSLGRLPHNKDINISLVAFEVARLAQSLSEKYNLNPTNPDWKYCYERIYLAFKPKDQAGIERGDGLLAKVDKGPLNKHKAIVADAYQLTLPLFRHVLDPKTGGTAFPAKLTEPLDEWIQKKRPEDNRVAPTLKPLAAAERPKQNN